MFFSTVMVSNSQILYSTTKQVCYDLQLSTFRMLCCSHRVTNALFDTELCEAIVCCLVAISISFKGITLLLMGTAEELPAAPVEKTVFIEDMTEDQLTSAV